ncbi:MAG: YIP1 family protein [Nitrososphaerota archaeon]
MFEVKGLGKIDFNYMILKTKSLLLEPMKAQKTLEEIMSNNPGLITGIVYIAIVAFISAIGTTISLLFIPFAVPLISPFIMAGMVLGTLIISPIVNVIVWAILTVISFIIGRYLTKQEIKIDIPLVAPLAMGFAFASAPSILNIIPWRLLGVLGGLIVFLINGWSYYYTWLSAKSFFKVDEGKALIITIIQLLIFLSSLASIFAWSMMPWYF